MAVLQLRWARSGLRELAAVSNGVELGESYFPFRHHRDFLVKTGLQASGE
jgi:hypothetical protein